MRALYLLIVLGGCIDAALVPCGDLACPAGDVCLAGSRCVSPDQLQLCAGKPEGGDCVVGGLAGKCQGGACEAVICGNGIVDPGEVCDDGNRTSGDGCNGTCTSTETCGNGIVDAARGEGCDCGTAANPSALCAHPNSADTVAECSLDCKPRFCGDGVIDTIEQCDGGILPAGASCAQFGYYGGALTCSSYCQLDPAPACTGRCGDGVVQPSHEYCDGALPAGASCVGFGYDEGVMSCGAGCGADLGPCGTFGWSFATDRTDHVARLWAGSGRAAVVYDSGDAWVRDGADWAHAPATYDAIGGSATTVVAAGGDHLASWTAAAGWTTLTPPWPSGSTVSDVWASDSLGVFVSLVDTAPLWHADSTGTWTQVTGSWDPAAYFGQTLSKLWVISSTVQTWDGTTWDTPSIPDPAYMIVESLSGGVWAQTDFGIVFEDTTGTWKYTDLSFQLQDAGLDGVYGTNGICGLGCTYNLYYAGATRPMRFDYAGGELVRSDGQGRIYESLATGGLNVLAYGEWRTEMIQSAWPAPVGHAKGGPLCIGGYYVHPEFGYMATTPKATGCSIALISAAGSVYCTDPGNGTLTDDDDAGVSGIDPQTLWMGLDDVATGGADSFAWRSGGVWATATPAITFTELAGDAVTDLYAIGTGDGDASPRIWHFDGTTWQSATSPLPGLAHLVVTPTAAYALDSAGLIRYGRATATVMSVAVPVPLNLLAGDSGEELFGATAIAPARSSILWHFDGTSWAPVTLPAGTGAVQGLAAYGAEPVLTTHPGPTNQIVSGYYRLQRTGPW